MRWLRLYDEIIDDPKVLQLSREIRWSFVEVLCIANRQTARGSLPSLKEIAIHMRLSLPKTTRVIEQLIGCGLIDKDHKTQGLTVHNWHKRQFKSDDITARTSASKERSRERSQEQSGERSVETDTETETDTESVCVTHAREGDDLRDWEEALAELQDHADSRLIAEMLRESAEVPSVARLEAWRFIHAARVLRGQEAKTWNFFIAVAARASRRTFDAWHAPRPEVSANGHAGGNGYHETPAQARRRRLQDWARSDD